MLATSDPIEAEAIGWHIRLREGDAELWVAFTRWLEADARHAAAYDAVARADADLGDLTGARSASQ